MLITENVVSILPTCAVAGAKVIVDEEKKPRKSVCFNETVCTMEYDDLGKSCDIWHSKLDLKFFKAKAKALSDHLHQSQPMLAREIEEAHNFAHARATEGADHLFTKWHKLSSGRRGLERFVLDKNTRESHIREIQASRSVVFNLQCLFRRSSGGTKLTDPQAEMVQQQYYAFTRPAALLAQIYAAKDAAAVLPYYQDEDEHDEDEEELEEDAFLDDGVLSVGSGSVSSKNSKSAKKVKKRSDKESSSSPRRKSFSKKSSSKKSSKIRSHSPTGTRRMRNVEVGSDFERRGL